MPFQFLNVPLVQLGDKKWMQNKIQISFFPGFCSGIICATALLLGCHTPTPFVFFFIGAS